MPTRHPSTTYIWEPKNCYFIVHSPGTNTCRHSHSRILSESSGDASSVKFQTDIKDKPWFSVLFRAHFAHSSKTLLLVHYRIGMIVAVLLPRHCDIVVLNISKNLLQTVAERTEQTSGYGNSEYANNGNWQLTVRIFRSAAWSRLFTNSDNIVQLRDNNRKVYCNFNEEIPFWLSWQ